MKPFSPTITVRPSNFRQRHITAIKEMDFNYRHVDLTGDNATIYPRDYQLKKRQEQCDQSSFFCPTGSCFTDADNGWIGCCTVSNCVPRTRCIAYNPATTHNCDPDTGGCLYCSDSANPGCMVITNSVANQWIMYCATTAGIEHVGYVNTITTGSIWTNPSPLVATANPSAIVTANSTPSSTSSGSAMPSTSASATLPPVLTSSTSQASSSASTSSHSSAITFSSIVNNGSPITIFSSKASQSSSLPSSTSAAALLSTQGAQQSTMSTGKIVGAVVGGFSGAMVLAAMAFVVFRYRRYRKRRGQAVIPAGEKDGHSDHQLTESSEHSPVEVEGSTPKVPSQYFSPAGFSPYHEVDSKQVTNQPLQEKGKADGLGISPAQAQTMLLQSRYRLSNPDESSTMPEQRVSDGSHLISPLLPASINSEGSTPLTPRPEHSSVQNQAAMHANHNSIQYDGQDTPYSMSIYWDQPPGSITNTASSRPPSLPQPYSLSELPATTYTPPAKKKEAISPEAMIHRTAGRDSPSPWAYLSPEQARDGGWVNPAEDHS